MKLGAVLMPNGSPQSRMSIWQACDTGGLDAIGIADSPAIARELYVSAATCLAGTSKALVMPAVTNPVSRDVSTVASALATLDELAPGRVALGIGTGDSALWGVGLKPARVEQLRKFIVGVKTLVGGMEAEIDDRRFALAWNDWDAPSNIPVYVACSGPKVLRMAASVADGVILAMGFGPDNLAYVRELIEQGCSEVGRDPSAVEIWGHGSLTFGDTVEEAKSENLGVNPGWMTMSTLDGKQIPEEFAASLRQLTRDFGDLSAEYADESRGAMLVRRAKELGIYEWITARAPQLWGPPDVIAKRLLELEAEGVANWLFYVYGSDQQRMDWIERFTSGVLPALGRGPAT